MKNGKKGITLIALVITIVVMLILAIVTINLTLGENGILNRAKFAKDKYSNAQDSESNVVDGYLSILDENGTPIVTGSRTEAWNGATMLTITVTNISGGTFTINVNNLEASNYGKLYYYVNNKLVYSGTDKSFKVTQVDGQLLQENQTYKVKVLAEPFEMSVTTGEGDNVDSWLACIGNPNSEGYTIENLDDLLENKTLMNQLVNSSEAMEYMLKSDQIIMPRMAEKNMLLPFSQTKLTADTTTTNDGNIVVTASCYDGNSHKPYMAFNNAVEANCFNFNRASANGEWLKIVYPYNILVTGLDFYTRKSAASANAADSKITVYTSENKDKLVAETITTSQLNTKYTMRTKKVATNTFFFYVTNSGTYFGFQNVQIHGYKIKN